MRRAKVIDRAHQKHPSCSVRVWRANARHRRASGARRSRNVAFSRSMYAVLLTPSPCDRRRSVSTRAGVPSTMRRSVATTRRDLRDQDMPPRTQPWPPTCARVHGITKGLPNGPDVGHQAICAAWRALCFHTAGSRGACSPSAWPSGQPHSYTWPQCPGFSPVSGGTVEQRYQRHLSTPQGPFWEEPLAFRDSLVAHPDEAATTGACRSRSWHKLVRPAGSVS
jgi:hypothetical protein